MILLQAIKGTKPLKFKVVRRDKRKKDKFQEDKLKEDKIVI